MAKLYCLKNFNDIIFYERLDNKVRYEKVLIKVQIAGNHISFNAIEKVPEHLELFQI